MNTVASCLPVPTVGKQRVNEQTESGDVNGSILRLGVSRWDADEGPEVQSGPRRGGHSDESAGLGTRDPVSFSI